MEFSKASAKNLLLVIVTTLLIIWILFRTSSFFNVVENIMSVIMPFIIGGCIAFVMNEALKATEKGWSLISSRIIKGNQDKAGESKAKRPICLFLSFIVVIAAIGAVFFLIIPELKATAFIFKEAIPGYIDQIKEWSNETVRYLSHRGINLPESTLDFDVIKEKTKKFVASEGGDFLNATVSATSSVFGVIVNIFLALAFSVFILADKEKLITRFKRFFRAVLSEKKYEQFMHVLKVANKSFSNYVTGQLTEAVIIGMLCFIGMTVFRIPYASAVSVLVGFTALIPMFGAFIGTAIGAFLILFVAPMKAFWFIVFIIVLQQFEGNVIYPRVVGKSVGLPGIWVLAAVTIGGSTFGIIGILIGVPLFSTIYELTKEFVRNKEERLK